MTATSFYEFPRTPACRDYLAVRRPFPDEVYERLLRDPSITSITSLARLLLWARGWYPRDYKHYYSRRYPTGLRASFWLLWDEYLAWADNNR